MYTWKQHTFNDGTDSAQDVYFLFPNEKKELEAENRELRERTYCAYCGEMFVIDDEAATKVSEHIHTCEKHPIREVKAERDRLRELVDAQEGYMAYQRLGRMPGKVIDRLTAAQATLEGRAMLERLREKVCEKCGDGEYDILPCDACKLQGKPTGKRFPKLWEWHHESCFADDLVPKRHNVTDALIDIWFDLPVGFVHFVGTVGLTFDARKERFYEAMLEENRQEALASAILQAMGEAT